MQAHAIPGPWAAGERLLVCVSEDPRAAGLVRYTKRLADRLHGLLDRALCRDQAQPAAVGGGARSYRRHAAPGASAGREPVTIPGGDRRIADDVVSFAQANNITQIVIGKSTRSPWFELLHGSVVRDLLRSCGNISVHVIAGEHLDKEVIPKKTVRTAEKVAPFDPRPYVVAIVAVAAALGVGKAIQPWLELRMWTSCSSPRWSALLCATVFGRRSLRVIVGSLCYNFFFLPPVYTFTIADPTNVAAFFFFTAMAVVVSNVAARVRTLAVSAMARARATESLYVFSRKLSGAGTLDDVLWATAYQAASLLKVKVVLLLPEDGSITVKAGYPPEDILDEADLAAAKWAWEHNRAAGRGSDTLPGAKWLFLPMRTGRGAIGVVGIDSDKPGPLLTPDQRRLLDALADQAALAIERVHLVEDLDQAKRRSEADRLRSALLTSISHDLKTPLAGILGAASMLKGFAGELDGQDKVELVATIIEELERLNRFIANLLDMTRLEPARSSRTRRRTISARSSGSALERASKILARHHRWRLRSPTDLPHARGRSRPV